MFSVHLSRSAAEAAGGVVERFCAHMDDAPCWKHSFVLKPLFAKVQLSITGVIVVKIILYYNYSWPNSQE